MLLYVGYLNENSFEINGIHVWKETSIKATVTAYVHHMSKCTCGAHSSFTWEFLLINPLLQTMWPYFYWWWCSIIWHCNKGV